MSTDFFEILTESLREKNCWQLTLSKPPKHSGELQKVTIRPVTLKGEFFYQFAYRTPKQESHENLDPVLTLDRVQGMLPEKFLHCHLFTEKADYEARFKPGGKYKLKQSPPSRQAESISLDHNRRKKYIIPENEPCPFLERIGVMTRGGNVKSARQHKFRQINRFLELVSDIMPHLRSQGTLNVIDFGCGKSYLTFALHHLLTQVYRRQVNIVGLDLKREVIEDCNQIARDLNCEGLSFREGDLVHYETSEPVHLCVSLHACDTATDAALAQAVRWETDVILSVPCCQHELLEQLVSPTLGPLTQHGILKERFAALATDALRARVLEFCGYKTQVVEFIDLEHTPKNLLIRAIRQRQPASVHPQEVSGYLQFKNLLHMERFTLEQALGDLFPLGGDDADDDGEEE